MFSDKLNQVEDKIWYDKAIQQCVAETFGDELAHQCRAGRGFAAFCKLPSVFYGECIFLKKSPPPPTDCVVVSIA